LITDMNQPLADAAGNVVELRNCLDFLKGGKTGTRLETVVLAFAAEMLTQAGIVKSLAKAEAKAHEALSSGKAAELFARMVHALGGPADLLDHSDRYLTAAPVQKPVLASSEGWLMACDARAIGMSVIDLGGGRRHPQDKIDHRVGFSDILLLGTKVSKGDRIATIHAADETSAERAAADLAANYRIGDTAPVLPPVIVSRI
jgi:thymidine phosphorylase